MKLLFTGENTGCRFLKEVISTSEFLGDATLGSYTSDDRIPKWNSINVFEESNIEKKRNSSNAYIYNWRSFTNPANSLLNNAHEMGSRMWEKFIWSGGFRFHSPKS